VLETPEGDRIGINLTTALLADIDDSGRLLTPYAAVADPGRITWFPPDADAEHVIGDLAGEQVSARYAGGILARVGDDLHRVAKDAPDLLPVHPQQMLGISSALIPFLAHDDANRALMAANMQKQAMPLRNPEAPLVQTGLERIVVRDMGPAAERCADKGVLALGRNLLTAFMSWEGYNFEDGYVVSEDVVKKGLLDTVQVREYTVAIRVDNHETLDVAALVREGAEINGGDLLIPRIRTRDDGSTVDTSIRMPAGRHGTVTRVEHCRVADGHRLGDGVSERVCVTVESDRPLCVGDKLCTRHGAKGVVAAILPTEEMPILPDGRRVELMASPLGVPSRMNIGGVLEAHIGLAAHALGTTIVTPGFCGATTVDIETLLIESGQPVSGMFQLRDGRTGRLFDQETTVGYLYFLRLDHMVADKRQERAVGPYAPDGQPVRGRRNRGGIHLGIMETWALQAHRASHILREMLTLKSDDITARNATYDALVEGCPLPPPTVPESIRRLTAQLRGLCLDLQVFAGDGQTLDLFAPDRSTSAAATARLQFASAQTMLQWSAGEITNVADIGDVTGHIQLATSVKHAWRDLAPDCQAEIPELTVVPVIPPALRGGSKLDSAYAAVIEANNECREQNAADGTAEALQKAVDVLLDSLTRLLYGKKGWITSTLSGKTVDYSGRSVICPGPELEYDTCSLPIPMAAVLFEPFVVGEMLRAGTAADRDQAVMLLGQQDAVALDALKKVVADKYVLLHRAPTLHRMGIQAFRPVLADEDVIRVHPLTLVAFNGDFDGDEMDVFLPLGPEAQSEARELVASSRCQIAPANGLVIAFPSQDMVLGCYYATCGTYAENGEVPSFDTVDQLVADHETGVIGIHSSILFNGRRTTVGQALFNALLPAECEWIDCAASKGVMRELVTKFWRQSGADSAARLANDLMRFGFHQATLSGLSLGKDTLLQVSSFDKRLTAAWARDQRIIAQGDADDNYYSACSELTAHWTGVTRGMTEAAFRELAEDRGGLNPLHLMLASAARGNRTQGRQHISMRGLMALPDGRIMRSPITTSFLKGHSPLEYFVSTFGARKGLADTALKTSDAGWLFKRIVNVVQDVVVTTNDCGCTEGVLKTACRDDDHEWLPLGQRITGRVLARPVRSADTGETLLAAGELVTAEHSARIVAAGVTEVTVRSPVTCRVDNGVCATCYGLNLETWQLPGLGQTVGITAAQAIGEPCTQLTMRTFHVAVTPKCDPATRKNVRGDIIGGLPRLSQVLEAWTGRSAGNGDERAHVLELLAEQGTVSAVDYMLTAMQKLYRYQGVIIDDRHFEIVLARMFENGLQGISELAANDPSFLVCGAAYGGTPALARSAVAATEISLDTIRACTAFGKLIP